MNELKFKGWWGDGDEKEVPKPWETFHIVLHGLEAGDTTTGPREIKRILRLAGYKLTLEKVRVK